MGGKAESYKSFKVLKWHLLSPLRKKGEPPRGNGGSDRVKHTGGDGPSPILWGAGSILGPSGDGGGAPLPWGGRDPPGGGPHQGGGGEGEGVPLQRAPND